MVARGLSSTSTNARVLGSFGRGVPGPLVIAVGGMHGNEPGGVEACQRVLASLEEAGSEFRGQLHCVVGNLRALREGARYIDQDLNRLFAVSAEESAGLADQVHELWERDELVATLSALLAEHEEGPVVLLDMHSTSADGSPFSIMGDTLQNRRIAMDLPIPVILGLEERLEGTLLAWFSRLGHVAVCVEGGQSGLPTTADNLESALWLVLGSAGALGRSREALALHRQRLAHTAWGLPRVVEIRYRHPIQADERFAMEPGYENFHLVDRGELLAYSGGQGERHVRAPLSGQLLMPRYQGQGDDGFFLGVELESFWISLSALLRRLGVPRLLGALRGVRRRNARTVLLDPLVAGRRTIRLLNLCGYRHQRREGGFKLFVSRPEGR